MTGSFSIIVRWGDRKETSTACARRALVFLQGLESISKAFVGLASLDADGHPQAPHSPDEASLRHLLEGGMNHRDVDGSVIDDLGFSITLLNQDMSISIRLHCGVYCRVVPNTCTIDILKETDDTRELLSVSALRKVLQVAVRVWEPERGLVTSRELWEAVPQSKKGPTFGWLTYLSRKYSIPRGVHRQYVVTPVDRAGHLILAVEEDENLVDFHDTSRVQGLVTAFGAN